MGPCHFYSTLRLGTWSECAPASGVWADGVRPTCHMTAIWWMLIGLSQNNTCVKGGQSNNLHALFPSYMFYFNSTRNHWKRPSLWFFTLKINLIDSFHHHFNLCTCLSHVLLSRISLPLKQLTQLNTILPVTSINFYDQIDYFWH